MECGEIDFAHILAKHQGVPLGLNFIRVYWQQMLQAVQAIHEEKIVHSDLKPANFLLVQGQLKLIDFGIAKRMGDDTTNIHRDQQVPSPRPPEPAPAPASVNPCASNDILWTMSTGLLVFGILTPPEHLLFQYLPSMILRFYSCFRY